MVLIEQETEPEEIQPKNDADADAGTGTGTGASKASTRGHADAASDGFETASEGDVESDRDDSDDPRQPDEEAPAESRAPLPSEPAVAEPQAGPAEDDASIQDALTKANDAKLEGNKLFAAGQYEEALSQYELALQLVPEMPTSVEIRSICHSNRAVCFLKMGKYEDTVKECKKALELNPTYVKALIRRAEAHEKLENFEESIADRKKILELDPSNDEARKAILRLEPLAAEKREKMKEEMIGKLKEMGNSILGRFGMSIDNFKTVKDPNTGSYSVQFQR